MSLFSLSAGLCNSRAHLNSEQNILKAIDEDAYGYLSYILGDEPFVKSSVLESADLLDLYISLVVTSMLHQSIPRDCMIQVGVQSLPLLNIIERLDIFIEPDEEAVGSIRLIFPSYVIRHLLGTLMVRRNVIYYFEGCLDVRRDAMRCSVG